MKKLVIVTQDFAHGALNARKDDELVMEESLVRDLHRFVRVKGEADEAKAGKMAAETRNKMRPDSLDPASGKAPAAGSAPPSSSSPAAPASPRMMSNKSEPGDKGKRKGRPPGA